MPTTSIFPRRNSKPNSICALSRSTAERPAIGYSRYVVLDADLKPWPKALQPPEPLHDGDIAEDLFARKIHIPRDFVMPKALYHEAGGYDPSIPLYEDWDLKLRLAARADFFPDRCRRHRLCAGRRRAFQNLAERA